MSTIDLAELLQEHRMACFSYALIPRGDDTSDGSKRITATEAPIFAAFAAQQPTAAPGAGKACDTSLRPSVPADSVPSEGMARTVFWTEIATAMRADGIIVPDKSGPAMAKLVRETVALAMRSAVDGGDPCTDCGADPGQRCAKDCATTHTPAAAVQTEPDAHDMGGNLSPEHLAQLLDAKYRRHGEDEDRQAAEMLRKLAPAQPFTARAWTERDAMAVMQTFHGQDRWLPNTFVNRERMLAALKAVAPFGVAVKS